MSCHAEHLGRDQIIIKSLTGVMMRKITIPLDESQNSQRSACTHVAEGSWKCISL